MAKNLELNTTTTTQPKKLAPGDRVPNQLRAQLHNLGTTGTGVGGALTKSNQRTIAAMQRLAARTSGRSGRIDENTLRNITQNYGAALGQYGFQALAPARATAKATRIEGRADVASGQTLATAGAKAMVREQKAADYATANAERYAARQLANQKAAQAKADAATNSAGFDTAMNAIRASAQNNDGLGVTSALAESYILQYNLGPRQAAEVRNEVKTSYGPDGQSLFAPAQTDQFGQPVPPGYVLNGSGVAVPATVQYDPTTMQGLTQIAVQAAVAGTPLATVIASNKPDPATVPSSYIESVAALITQVYNNQVLFMQNAPGGYTTPSATPQPAPSQTSGGTIVRPPIPPASQTGIGAK